MQRHQLLVTPPQQAGKRARREEVMELVVGGDHGWVGGWLDWRVGSDEKVRKIKEGRAGILSAVISFVYRTF